MEIERKWKLNEFPDFIYKTHPKHIKQYYIGDGIRLRTSYDVVGEFHYRTLTVKSIDGDLAVREEWESSIPSWTFEQVYRAFEYRATLIEKTRYLHVIQEGDFGRGILCEVDVFKDRPLILMKIEFTSKEEADQFILPSRFDEYVVEEVTNDPTYLNQHLSTPVV